MTSRRKLTPTSFIALALTAAVAFAPGGAHGQDVSISATGSPVVTSEQFQLVEEMNLQLIVGVVSAVAATVIAVVNVVKLYRKEEVAWRAEAARREAEETAVRRAEAALHDATAARREAEETAAQHEEAARRYATAALREAEKTAARHEEAARRAEAVLRRLPGASCLAYRYRFRDRPE